MPSLEIVQPDLRLCNATEICDCKIVKLIEMQYAIASGVLVEPWQNLWKRLTFAAFQGLSGTAISTGSLRAAQENATS